MTVTSLLIAGQTAAGSRLNQGFNSPIVIGVTCADVVVAVSLPGEGTAFRIPSSNKGEPSCFQLRSRKMTK
jgi:hypothetical protein